VDFPNAWVFPETLFSKWDTSKNQSEASLSIPGSLLKKKKQGE